jgi:hypothetical protein
MKTLERRYEVERFRREAQERRVRGKRFTDPWRGARL